MIFLGAWKRLFFNEVDDMNYSLKSEILYVFEFIFKSLLIGTEVILALAALALVLAIIAFALTIGVSAAYWVFGWFTLSLLL